MTNSRTAAVRTVGWGGEGALGDVYTVEGWLWAVPTPLPSGLTGRAQATPCPFLTSGLFDNINIFAYLKM